MKFYVNYFGCRTNQAEVQDWIIDLENSGYQLVSSIDDADFGIINTCSVTEKAEKDVLRFIGKIYKRTNKKWIITGCTVAKEKEDLKSRYRNYIFLNNREKSELIESIKERFPTDRGNVIFHSSYRSRIFIKVQDGCNLRCSFCIVPCLRGKSQSLTPEQVFNKATYLASLGYREIILSGVNLSAYGYDLFPRENLLGLVKELARIEEIDFIRLSSLDPRYVEFNLIKELSQIPKIAQSFHLSFQSGSNAVLRRMNRRSKIMDFRKILKDFSRFYPEANFGSDIIVGFPQETEKEFQETVEFIKESPLNYLHVFPFSPREGTKAETMVQVPDNVVRRRTRLVKEINTQMRLDYRERFIGRTLEGILIEESDHYALVVTSNFLTVRIPPVKGYKKKKIALRVEKVVNENMCEGIPLLP
jgi:threonylcarbamoyladenosine tRNA methylthiotransferase MtaB